jgi:hypothetical protein
LELHTIAGLIGLVCWSVFLIAPEDADWSSIIGVIGLGCWWVVAFSGIVILLRWRTGSSRGKRAASVVTAADTWTSTPWLSILAHVGVFIAVGWFTFAYLTSVI